MAITGVSSINGNQIIAAGASVARNVDMSGLNSRVTYYTGSEVYNQPGELEISGNNSYISINPSAIDFKDTADFLSKATINSGSIDNWNGVYYHVASSSGDWTGKQDTLTFGYTDDQISQINGSGIYSQGGGGGEYTGNVQGALDEVYSNSGNWNSVYSHVSTASGSWTGGGGAGVVTATGGTTTYLQTINGLDISAKNAGSAVSATNAYNLTNTAINVASATSANFALAVTNGVTSTTAKSIVYTASLPGSPVANTLYLIPE